MLQKLTQWLTICNSSIAILLNIYLIYLIITKSPKSFGSFVNLLAFFSCNVILFSALLVFLQPMVSVYGYIVYAFTNTNYLNASKEIMIGLLAFNASSYCQILILIAIQFIHRYLSICKKSRLYYFNKRFLFYWFALVFLIGFYWGCCLYFITKETEYSNRILGPVFYASYGLHITEVYYVAVLYIVPDPSNLPNGKMGNPLAILMIITFMFILGFSTFVICYCCRKIFKNVRRTGTSSLYYEKVQQQLFKACLIQMLTPILFMYLPVLGVFILPLFYVNNPSSICSILISTYPVIHPVAIILIISDYRAPLFKTFKSRPVQTNKIYRLVFRLFPTYSLTYSMKPILVRHLQ